MNPKNTQMSGLVATLLDLTTLCEDTREVKEQSTCNIVEIRWLHSVRMYVDLKKKLERKK